MQKTLAVPDSQKSTKCDRCVLNLLRPHWMQAERNDPTFSQFQPTLTQFKQALDQQGVISLTLDGQVQFITKQAMQLLNQYFLPQNPHALSDMFQNWFKEQILQLTMDLNIPTCYLPLRIERSEQQLIIHLIFDPVRKHYLLLLEEQKSPSFSVAALESLGLTKREAEVLFWIARDKSNAGIAKVLGCCEGTVRKHLENVYKKLNVQTRMGAAMTALERLGLLRV